MAPNTKRVFYVKYVAAPNFLEILGRRPDVQVSRLENDSPEAMAAPVLEAAHAYQVGAARDELDPKYHVTAALLARTPNLLAVSSNGAGYDTVDVDACTAAGVIAVNQAGGNKEAVAEHVLAMMLTLSKRIVETDRYMRRQSDIPRNDFIGHDLTGRTVGIVGLGNVGGRVAELCRGLFRMRVLAFDPYLDGETIAARGAEKATLDQLLAQSDYVSINCPRNAETRGMIGAAQYALMQKHAYFITTARGGIHDEAALAQALAAGRIAGAGLDVWEKEPPPHTHPLLAFDNVVVSPHTAGVTVESRTNIARVAAEQMLDILDGKRPPRLLNPEVWPAYRERFGRILGFMPEA
ncbi:MAG: hydroxyacid dehydrogenase [Proteobacteria bacterium]|nr:hydroxyacid dehydrogenase [Pseudomonadota bacterium]